MKKENALPKATAATKVAVWKTEDSIIQFLNKHRLPSGELSEEGQTLPDDALYNIEVDIVNSINAFLMAFDEEDEMGQEFLSKLLELLIVIADTDDEQAKLDFYNEVIQIGYVNGVVLDLSEKLFEHTILKSAYLYEFGKSLVTQTNNRRAVQFGMEILGSIGKKEDAALMKILGSHEEFMTFAAIALLRMLEDAQADIVAMASRASSGTKYELVELLSENCQPLSAATKRWLLVGCYKRNEWRAFAYRCVEACDMNAQLRPEVVDDAVFKGAGALLYLLIDRAHMDNGNQMVNYLEAAETIENYIRHAGQRNLSVRDYEYLDRLKYYLENYVTPEHATLGRWDTSEKANCIIDLHRLLNLPDWEAKVYAGVLSKDKELHDDACQVGLYLNLAFCGVLWQKVLQDPEDYWAWKCLVQANPSEAEINAIVAHAQKLFPTKEVSFESVGNKILDDDSIEGAYHSFIRILSLVPSQGESYIMMGLASDYEYIRLITTICLHIWAQSSVVEPQYAEALKKLLAVENSEYNKEWIERTLARLAEAS